VHALLVVVREVTQAVKIDAQMSSSPSTREGKHSVNNGCDY